MQKIVVVKLAPAKNIPRSTYVVKTTAMSGDADLYQDFTKRVTTDEEALSMIALLYFYMQEQEACRRNRTQVNYLVIEEQVNKIGLLEYKGELSDLFCDMVGGDVTNEGEMAYLTNISLSWFNESGTEYICAFNKPGTDEMVESLYC